MSAWLKLYNTISQSNVFIGMGINDISEASIPSDSAFFTEFNL